MNTTDVYRLTINHRQAEGTDILKIANAVKDGGTITSGRGVTVKHIGINEIGNVLTTDKDTQIISPYNELNNRINTLLKVGEHDLNIGDKVMLTRNTNDYCNGDIGTITNISEDHTFTIQIEGRTVSVANKHADDITLAYAITVHKMQGSESRKVILFIPEYSNIDKRMLYTAITRAREELEIYYYMIGKE